MKKMLIIFLFLNICISNSVPKWEKTKFDFDDVAVRAMVIKDSTLYVNSKQGFYISKDNADSWEKMSTFFNDKASITLATINDTIFIGTQSEFDTNGLYVSYNNGKDWKYWNFYTTDYRFTYGISKLFIYNRTLFIGTVSDGIYRLVNLDGSIYELNYGFDAYGKIPSNNREFRPTISDFLAYKDKIYVSTTEGIFKNKNSLYDWDMFLYAGIDFKQREINCAVQNEIYLYTGTSNGVYKANLNEIEKSILFDAKFTNVLKNFEIRSLLAVNNLIIAGTADHGIYYSNDNGKNWQSGGLEFNTISSLGYNDKYIYAGTLESGVLRINKNQFLISYNHVDENAQSIQIEIFPNPSSDNLNIKLNYEPLENEEVSIIDMLGQNILTQNIKSIETNIKLSNLQSGIYYAKFKNRREVIKFEVVK